MHTNQIMMQSQFTLQTYDPVVSNLLGTLISFSSKTVLHCVIHSGGPSQKTCLIKATQSEHIIYLYMQTAQQLFEYRIFYL